MKNSLTGLLCTCLLLAAGTLPGRAQEKKPDPQPSQPASAASSDAASADQQTPPQSGVQQTPPAGQPPATGQLPTPPPVSETPRQTGRVPPAPPPPVKIPDVRRPGESGFWFGVQGWFPKQDATFNRGNKPQFSYTESSLIKYQGKPKYAGGIELGLQVGLHNSLRADYLDVRNAGNFTTHVDLVAAPQLYTANTLITTNYHFQTGKLSYEYLTWPFPVGSRKIRFKTLWQVQFTQIHSSFDSPLAYYNAAGNLILDSSGHPIDLSATHTKHIVGPMFGALVSYYPARHVRLEVSGSGFGFPHHYSIWNSEATINLRALRHFELRAGARALGFKTSTSSDYFIHGTYAAAFVGLRWYSNSE